MSNGLKIYACSGLGSLGIGTTPENFNYWTDDTVTTSNTKAVNSLLSDINMIGATLMYGKNLTDEEVLQSLNLIDLYTVCLKAAELYNNNELVRFGNIIGKFVEEGRFEYNSLDNEERDRHLQDIYEEIEALFLLSENYIINNSFTEWFSEKVVAYNYCGYSKEQQEQALKFISDNGAVSGSSVKDAADYLTNCGGYYLYLFADKEQQKHLPYEVVMKQRKEEEMYKYIHKAYDPLYNDPDKVDNIIYAGCCGQYKHTPDRVLSVLTTGKSGGVGCGIAEIISAVAALLTVLITALQVILSFVGTVVQAKYSAPTNPEEGTPADYDWEEDKEKDTEKSKYLKWGIIGLIIYYITQNK